MQKTSWLRRLALLAVVALFTAACGTDGGGDAPASEPAAESEAASEMPSEAESEASEMPSEEASEEDTEGAAAPSGEGDGVLTLGTLLPETGSLAFLGPPEFAGVELAAQEINEAGGVLGEDVEVVNGDSGDTTTDIANQTVDRLLSQDADVIIGAASSGVSFTVIDKITRAGVVQFSPANTSPDFTDYDDNGLYFRTAPSDVLQGRVLGEKIIEDGNATVGILALQDPYGEGLAENVSSTVTELGGEVTPEPIIYDPNAQNYAAEVQQVASADPDAVVVIGFDESARIVTTMIEEGIGPADKAVYFVDGNTSSTLGEDLPQGSFEGIQGTLPGAETTGDFRERLLEVDPQLEDFSYAGESYDAAVVSALAAVAAESDAGVDIGAEIPDATREGEPCTTYEDCLALLEEGEDIDYDGISGPIEMSDVGDPTVATIGIYSFDADNALTDDVEYREGEL